MIRAVDAPLLDGFVVVDLTRALAGPQASMMLADLGARVIKVESFEGDESRGWGPPFVGDDAVSTYFLSCNRNKESVTADLKSDDGRRLLEALVRQADVLIENFRPGVLARLGLSPERLEELNPGLVLCSLSGFGHDGPDAQRPGYDQIAQGEAGLMSITGPAGEPTKVGVPIGDLLTGMNGAFGVVVALLERERTGRTRPVRTSLLAGIVGIHAFQGTRYTVAGVVPGGEGNHHPSISPYGLFRTAGAPIQIACGNDALWHRLCAALEIEVENPSWAKNAVRVEHRDRVTAVLEDILMTESAEHWLGVLAEAGIPAGRVRTLDEVYDWEQTRSQGLVVEVDHPVLGRIELPGPALRFGDNDYAGGRESHTAPPLLGQHNDAVRSWLGLDSHSVKEVNA
ncbi:CoA transferase [Nocardioides gansuensis]|uniref:CoA transferase n=1 Tax=Nocardioides gansuensis TaxID=2138300 RepID=A0A2T8FCZ3_9ACTN|nr:CoA transferase [Nocardioides gansuensis]PVG83569.1 CoA transferase [Nocardioides gansuensis]